MSDVILGGNFTIYYSSDSGRKQIKWTGSATATNTVNQLYSALQDIFDELSQLDDGTPMSAQTPTEYTIGSIDASDLTPWFIDDETIQHLTGGAIKTNLWTRITGTQPGIVKVTCSANTSIIYADIGNAISNAAASTGTLIDMKGSGASTVLWIRPTDATSTHDWTATSNTITCNAHTATSAAANPVTTGEALWANIYSLGSISTDRGANPISDLYVYKNGSKVTALSSGASAYQWWTTGHIDILMKVKEAGATAFTGTTTNGSPTITGISISPGKLVAGSPIFGPSIPAGATISSIDATYGQITISANATGVNTALYVNTIDGSYITVFGREYDTTYDYFTVNLFSGGRNPIPLATGDDLNNHTGIRTLTASAGTGTFLASEIAYVGASLAAATAKAVITSVSGTGASSVITYYLIGNLTDFAGGVQTVTGAVSGATITNGSVADNVAAGNPATLSPAPVISSAVAGYSFDLNNGNGAAPYSFQVNAQSTHTLAKVYEWTKYVTRRGSTDTTNNNGINGEQYIGIDYKLSYTTLTGSSFSSGDVLFQPATGASGTVVTHDTTNKKVLLRNSRNSFGTGTVYKATGNSLDSGTTATSIAPIKPNPYGTFAGGKFFGAPGVYFTNYLAGDNQNFQLTDNNAVVQVPPNTVSVTITGLTSGDGAGVFRTTAGAIVKDTYVIASSPAAGATAVVVGNGSQTAVRSDEPSAGFIRVVKVSGANSEEHRYRYSAVNTGTKTFTLTTVTTGQGAVLTGSAATTVSGNLITVTLGTAISTSEVFVGDMVYTAASGTPTTPIAYGTVVKINTTTSLQVRVIGTVTLGNWSGAGNVIVFNKLVSAYTNTTDKVYVPLVDSQATTSQLSNSLIYSADINVLVRVRQYRNILPFEQSTIVGSTGLTVSAIRTADSIAT